MTKKTGINYTPHEGLTFQNILDQGMIKHLFDFEMEYITYIISNRRMDKVSKELDTFTTSI